MDSKIRLQRAKKVAKIGLQNNNGCKGKCREQ
jgi:hypothetical protein